MSKGGWKCTRIQQNSRNIEPIDQWPMANGHGGNLVSHSQLRITGRLTMVLKGLSPIYENKLDKEKGLLFSL